MRFKVGDRVRFLSVAGPDFMRLHDGQICRVFDVQLSGVDKVYYTLLAETDPPMLIIHVMEEELALVLTGLDLMLELL